MFSYAPDPQRWIDPFGLKKCNINKGTQKRFAEAGIPRRMKNPHMHHIVMEGDFSKWGPEARKYVTKARTLLRKHKISLQGDDNVVWARNWDHSQEYAKSVYNKLAEASPGGREAVRDALNEIGDTLGKGKKFRF